ncbi:MAG: winged helix DNA-binding protein [Chloroflexi bacterium]|nr:winged helix DNA-binding protein [Chloroflexota bacterium]
METEPTQAQVAALRQQHTGRLFWRAHRAFGELAFEKLHERGYDSLSTVHTNLLANLDIEGTNVTTLADRAGITKQAMGRLVDDLEEKGYVQSMSDPTDGRAKLIHFTDAGWQFLLDSYEIKQEIEALYTAALGEEGVAQLRAALEKVAEITSSHALEP